MAGALAEISRQALARDFRHIDPRQARIILVEGMARVLPAVSRRTSRTRRGRSSSGWASTVWTGARVTGIDDGAASSWARSASRARTVVWAAGVAASPLARTLGVPLDRAGRVLVEPDLTIPGHDDVFVIGDLAALEQDGDPVPGVAPAAIQEGRHVARNIRARRSRGEPLPPFRYRDKGSFATIGRGAAVGELIGRPQALGLLRRGWPGSASTSSS